MSATVDRQDELVDDELVVPVPNTQVLSVLAQSEHESKVSTAKKFPRSIKQFQRSALELVTLSEEIASSCIYSLPRSDKNIDGPSVRFAEMIGAAYGNVSYGSRIVDLDDRFITAQGICYDFEKNISATIEVQRRITNKYGKKFNEDMIQVTGRAACAIALREAIFKILPRALWLGIYDQARIVSVGAGKTMEARRTAAMEWWKKAGASEKLVLDYLKREGVQDITIDDLVLLNGVRSKMKEEGLGVDVALAVQSETEPANGKQLDKAPSAASKAKGKTDIKEPAKETPKVSIAEYQQKLNDAKTPMLLSALRGELVADKNIAQSDLNVLIGVIDDRLEIMQKGE